MRIVVTRPLLSGRRTAEKLRERGHEPVLLPLSEPLHDGQAAQKALAQPHSALAVTSAEAIRAFPVSQPRDALLFCVGRATAETARAAGFSRLVTAQGTGADLARHILAHFRETGMPEHPLLYLAGHPRSPDLERALETASLPVTIAECYRMLPVAHDPALLHALLVENPADAVLLYSRETARRFVSLPVFRKTPAALSAFRFLCLSRNIAEALPQALAARAEIAPAPEEDALLDLL